MVQAGRFPSQELELRQTAWAIEFCVVFLASQCMGSDVVYWWCVPQSRWVPCHVWSAVHPVLLLMLPSSQQEGWQFGRGLMCTRRACVVVVSSQVSSHPSPARGIMGSLMQSGLGIVQLQAPLLESVITCL